MMKKRIQFFFGSIALLGMSACSNSYVKPDAPIKEVLSSTYKCNFLGADNKQ